MVCLANGLPSSSRRRADAARRAGRSRPGDSGLSSVRTPPLGRQSRSGAATIPLLRVVAGQDMLRFAVLTKEQVLEVGRDSQCTLSLKDASVSRRHLQVAWAEGGFRATDLRSRNGTRLNGEPVREGPVLKAGPKMQ